MEHVCHLSWPTINESCFNTRNKMLQEQMSAQLCIRLDGRCYATLCFGTDKLSINQHQLPPPSQPSNRHHPASSLQQLINRGFASRGKTKIKGKKKGGWMGQDVELSWKCFSSQTRACRGQLVWNDWGGCLDARCSRGEKMEGGTY